MRLNNLSKVTLNCVAQQKIQSGLLKPAPLPLPALPPKGRYVLLPITPSPCGLPEVTGEQPQSIGHLSLAVSPEGFAVMDFCFRKLHHSISLPSAAHSCHSEKRTILVLTKDAWELIEKKILSIPALSIACTILYLEKCSVQPEEKQTS